MALVHELARAEVTQWRRRGPAVNPAASKKSH
jgi:hypothetical protein